MAPQVKICLYSSVVPFEIAISEIKNTNFACGDILIFDILRDFAEVKKKQCCEKYMVTQKQFELTIPRKRTVITFFKIYN